MLDQSKTRCLPISANTISTQCTVENMASTTQTCTVLSVSDLSTEDGTNLKSQCGRRIIPIGKWSQMTSKQSQMNSKTAFSSVRTASSRVLNFSATRSKRSFEEATSESDSLTVQHDAAMKNANDWEDGVDRQYNEEDALTIMSMLSYFENIERGFGHLNDELMFKSERQSDVHGVLYEEATKGFELAKRCIHLRALLRKVRRISVQ